MKKIILSVIIVINLSNCNSTNIVKDIIGTWVCISNNNEQIYEFKDENKCIIHVNKRIVINGQYDIDEVNKRLNLLFENSKTAIKCTFQVKDDFLMLVIHKDIENQIDEILLLKKQSTKQNDISKVDFHTLKFLVPDGFIGNIYINYNHPKGSNIQYGAHENSIIRIPSSGKVITQDNINVFSYITKNLEFEYETSLEKIPFFIFNEYTNRLDDLLDKGFSIDSTCICLYGFNQIPREDIDEIYNKKIDGDVLMLSVDTLKNLIHNPYIGRYLNK
jgi:hypothetical protein